MTDEEKKWTRTLENIIDLYIPSKEMIEWFAKSKKARKQYAEWHRENIIMNLARNIRKGYINKKKRKEPSRIDSGYGAWVACGQG